MSETRLPVGVVHLVRACNPFEAFERFLTSYERANKEPQQELLLLFKGFDPNDPGRHGLATYQQRLERLPYRCLFVPDVGFDITPYFTAARNFEHPYFCFLNSFSQILDPDWLVKMHPHILRPGVGLVGATSSCLSYIDLYREYRHEYLGLPIYRSPLGRLRFRLATAMYTRLYDPFPNYFIRTNCFLISRDVMLKVRTWKMRKKTHAYWFESSRKGLTKQVMRMGLEPLVVGKDGIGYEKQDWHRSETFHQGEQRNLLVADNLTTNYANADETLRRRMSRDSWGADAAPYLTETREPDLTTDLTTTMRRS